ncbi:hypothetical protein AXF42_Ash007122 [Apostasia shenzhenica]|uniref:TIR domain-containing protein n=1 Tax=Apostasia shenzhenica TaxID=1088818 RepID=A0A2I0BF70_9ASPA|nr:hypothetical protein AXF42_Ash007122 [Apostasia shenzhenica]
MELQRESSSLGVLSTSRNLSSSSSFVSAIQSPFFSPRSPQACGLEKVQPEIEGSSKGTVLSGNPFSSLACFTQSELVSNLKFLASDVSYTNFYASVNLDAPATVSRNSNGVSPNNGTCSSSTYSQGTNNGHTGRREKPKRFGRTHGKLSFAWKPTAVSSAGRSRTSDVYIGFHGQKPSLLRFVNWLRAELELQGISCFASDRARCRNTRSVDMVERMMKASSFGVVILTKKSFCNPYSVEELNFFLGKRNLCPIYFDLSGCDCLARDIIERKGALWEKHGGELWNLYDGLEKDWMEAVDGLSRALNWQLEAFDGNWRDCILQAVGLLATRLELELILFGDVTGDAEKEYFELKTRHRRKTMLTGEAENILEEEVTKAQQSESSVKGKEPVLWKESEKEIEMQRLCSPQRQFRSLRGKSNTRCSRRRRFMKILYGKGIACISGDSGIGKTELALEYAYRSFQRYKMVLWVGGESRYIRQNYLSLRNFLDVDPIFENIQLDKGKVKCFEELEEEAMARVRKELMRDIPFLVVIDNLEGEKDWWDGKVLMDLLPRFGGETHIIITTRLPQVMNLEPMKLSYLSAGEALSLMKGGVKDYPVSEIDAMRIIEEKLGRLTLGLGIVGAILSEIPVTPSRLLDAINRMPSRCLDDRESVTLKRHSFLVRLLDVCLSIFDHADGSRSLATRMVQVCGFFAPAAISVSLLASAADKIKEKHRGSLFCKKYLKRAITCSFTRSRMKKSEAEASSMLVRFGMARSNSNGSPDCVRFHEIIKLYARKRGSSQVARAMVHAVSLRGSVTHSSEHLWAACFLQFGFGSDPVVVELKPFELMNFVKRVVLPLSIHAFVTFSRCNAALELLQLCTEAIEVAAESLVSRAEKWFDRSFCCSWRIQSDAQYTYLWQELALLKATILETRAKLMLRGGKYDASDDLIRNAIFIRTSTRGEQHPDTVSARETLTKLTRLIANVQNHKEAFGANNMGFLFLSVPEDFVSPLAS